MKSNTFLILLAAVSLFPGCTNGKKNVSTDTFCFEGNPAPIVPQGIFLVTPRWMPDGSSFLVSGRWGVGLFLMPLQDMTAGTVQTVDRSYYGHVEWMDPGNTFCLDVSGNNLKYTFKDGKLKSESTANCHSGEQPPSPWEIILYKDEERQIVFDAYPGGLKVIEGGEVSIIEGSTAWNAKVSPDGKRVAYCAGHLTDASLKIYSVEESRTAALKGVYPSWLPDGKFLVYAEPVVQESASGRKEIVASDLYAYNVENDKSIRLTETPEVIEMEPAVSPEGSRVLFSDWKSGMIYVAKVEREVTQ